MTRIGVPNAPIPSGTYVNSTAVGAASGVASLTAAGVLPDAQGLGPWNLANSGAVGTPTPVTGVDHTAAIQAYIDTASARAKAMSSTARAQVIIDTGPLCYAVQNLKLPGNVKLRGSARFTYVDNSLGPPTGPGNYVLCLYGRESDIEGIFVSGNGTGQPWVGGVWLMPAGAAGPASGQALRSVLRDVTLENFGGRAVFDQGLANKINLRLATNCLLSATAIGHFMGVVEQAGTDGWASESEINAGVTTVSNGISVPRSPCVYNMTAIGTLSSTTALPLSNATVALSAAPASGAHGGALLAGGHLITYTGVSGASITGAYCNDSGSIGSGTTVYPALGFVAAFAVGGADNFSRDNVCEFGDVGIHIGPNVMAHATNSAALTTAGVGTVPVSVDNAAHLLTSGGSLGVAPLIGTPISFPQFAYTSISDTTTAAGVTLDQTPRVVQVASTTGWPATGTFTAAGYVASYASIVDATHIGGVTIASGSAAIASGVYIRSNTLNGCSVASGTLAITSGLAMTQGTAAGTRMTMPRADFPRTHGVIITGGDGQIVGGEVISGPVVADNTYYAWHQPNGANSGFTVIAPAEHNIAGTLKYARAIQDTNASGVNFVRWLYPKSFSAYLLAGVSGTAGGHVTLGDSPGVQAAVNSATPSVNAAPVLIDTNTALTTITNWTNGVQGQTVCFLQGVNTTIANNANIVTKSGSAITPPASGFVLLKFLFVGYGSTPVAAWYQI